MHQMAANTVSERDHHRGARLAGKDCTCARMATNHYAYAKTAHRYVPGLLNEGQQQLQHCSNQPHTDAHSVSERSGLKRPRTAGNDRRSNAKTPILNVYSNAVAQNHPGRLKEEYQHLHCSSNYYAQQWSQQATSARDECHPREGSRRGTPAMARATRTSARRAHSWEQQACA